MSDFTRLKEVLRSTGPIDGNGNPVNSPGDDTMRASRLEEYARAAEADSRLYARLGRDDSREVDLPRDGVGEPHEPPEINPRFMPKLGSAEPPGAFGR